MSKLVSVQILRAAAALSVAMLHAQHDAGFLAERPGLAFRGIDVPWTAGVDVFFVISGFIMVHASRGLFGEPEAGRIFLARRVARIVPLYWAVTTLYLAVALAAPALLNSGFLGWGPVLASYLFIPFMRPDGLVQPVYSLGWTLNYEMFFYLLFALAVGFRRRSGVVGLMLAFVALVALGRLAAPLPQPFGFWTDPILLEFAFGMALGLLRAEGFSLGALLRGALALLGLALLLADLTRTDGAFLLPRAVAHGVPAAMLVAAAALGPDREGASGWAHLAAAIGDASYALYLIHPFVVRALREGVDRGGLETVLGPWGFVALALLGSVVAALLVHRLFERPMTERVRRLLSGPVPTLPAGLDRPAR